MKQSMCRIAKFSMPVLGLAVLSACTSVGYRCPLEPGEEADSPTACTSMHQAYYAAKDGNGGQLSVMVDDKGRIIPREMANNQTATPLKEPKEKDSWFSWPWSSEEPSPEPYREKSGAPVFKPPKVFEVWASAFVDANGNLHDGHHAWFATPGRWGYGDVGTPKSGGGGSNLIGPSNPHERPKGALVTGASPLSGNPSQVQVLANPPKQPQAAKNDKATALKNLSTAADSARANARRQSVEPHTGNPAAGVTAPNVHMSDR